MCIRDSNIPFQPINFLDSEQGSFYEDDLIGYAWNKFLKSGADQKYSEWLPRFPMTRAVIRAMDLAQEITLQNDLDLQDFVVSGASKRGWTAWTTAAIDDRVVGVAPMVIDMLNLVPSFENHYRSYGEFSPAVSSYVKYDIQDWLERNMDNKLLHEMEINQVKRLIEYLQSVETPHSEAFEMPKLLNDFKHFYMQYDIRRNKNFDTTFPKLAEWYNSI